MNWIAKGKMLLNFNMFQVIVVDPEMKVDELDAKFERVVRKSHASFLHLSRMTT